jgi:hypothetical protein
MGVVGRRGPRNVDAADGSAASLPEVAWIQPAQVVYSSHCPTSESGGAFGMSAALTPRVRTLVICDGIRASTTEENVYHVRGARGHIVADSFPVRRRLRLFLVLASPRPGRFPAYVKVVENLTDRTIFYSEFNPPPLFERGEDYLPSNFRINVRFPRAGRYSVEFWFFQPTAADVLKMEQPLLVVERER